MKFTIVASGSKGNCSIIESKDTKIIIDCGSTVKYLKDSFSEIGFDYSKADGVLITHSHSDHVKQIKMFNMIDVYSPFAICGIDNWYQVVPNQVFRIKNLTIYPVHLSHDTNVTVGYIIFDGDETLVQITDTGFISEKNLRLIQGADYYIFESNHDVDMLMKSNRPFVLKKRIIGDCGHLSNDASAQALVQSVSDRTKEIVLAHISEECNDYELAYSVVHKALSENGLLRDDLKLKAVKQFEIYKGGSL